MTITPVGDRIAVRPDAEPGETESGLQVISSSPAHEAYKFGTVYALGPDARVVKGEDRVLFPRNIGIEIEHEGEVLHVFHEGDLIAVVSE